MLIYKRISPSRYVNCPAVRPSSQVSELARVYALFSGSQKLALDFICCIKHKEKGELLVKLYGINELALNISGIITGGFVFGLLAVVVTHNFGPLWGLLSVTIASTLLPASLFLFIEYMAKRKASNKAL